MSSVSKLSYDNMKAHLIRISQQNNIYDAERITPRATKLNPHFSTVQLEKDNDNLCIEPLTTNGNITAPLIVIVRVKGFKSPQTAC